MNRIALMALLALALPLTAFANTVDFTNADGTLAGSSAGLSLSGSTLVGVNGLGGGGPISGVLGSLSFSTSALASGSLNSGGTFNNGGTFVITGNGTSGIPNLVIFNGTFSGPVSWDKTTLLSGGTDYAISGDVTGTWYDGTTVNGATVQLTATFAVGTSFSESTTLSEGDTVINVPTPEPSTLGLLATGLLGLAGIARRKFPS